MARGFAHKWKRITTAMLLVIQFLFTPLSLSVDLRAQALRPSSDTSVPKQNAVDVVSIAENRSGGEALSYSETPDGIRFRNVSVIVLLMNAFGLRDNQIGNLPSWATTTRFDVSAKTTNVEPSPSNERSASERKELLEGILVSRFGLVSHRELREQTIFRLSLVHARKSSYEGFTPVQNSPSIQGVTVVNKGELEGDSMNSAMLAQYVSGVLGYDVSDATGLEGMYRVHLRWTPVESLDDGSRQSDYNAPDLATALKEQAGLMLSRSKGRGTFLVVDSLHRPTPN